MVEVDTVLFGKMQLPSDETSIIAEIGACRERFYDHPSRYLQTRIDYLEYELDEVTRRDV